MLKNMKFKTSAFNIAQLLETEKKQIVLVGKSNVGKSSFINSLANQKHLAKVGNTPGKTKSINYYDVNNEFYIAPLYNRLIQNGKNIMYQEIPLSFLDFSGTPTEYENLLKKIESK